MEQIQTQLHNEVILWKLRFIRGICTQESRQNFYELLRQFTTFHGMLDTVIDCETKYLDVMQTRPGEGEEIAAKVPSNATSENTAKQSGQTTDIEAKESSSVASDEKAFKRRRKFFAKVHERNVKLLYVVLNEVDECRSMVETNWNGHELSENFNLTLEVTGMKSLSVLEESNEEQQPEVRQQESAVSYQHE